MQGSVQEMMNLSQQDYVQRIEDLNNALINAWDQDQRVKALKIAIQVHRVSSHYHLLPVVIPRPVCKTEGGY